MLANRLFILEVMDKTIIIKSLQLYITRKNQKINRINRIILRESNLDNLSNLKPKNKRNTKKDRPAEAPHLAKLHSKQKLKYYSLSK